VPVFTKSSILIMTFIVQMPQGVQAVHDTTVKTLNKWEKALQG
jgi:hypothetical protein